MTNSRDIYGRRPTSQSRGKTHERIMALQHAPGTLPGADELLAGPDGGAATTGSIAAAIRAFHAGWVETQTVTVRRGYERMLVLLARDVAGDADGALQQPVATLTRARVEQHLAWRVGNGLVDRQELLRCGVHLHRLTEWLDANAGTAIGVTRDEMRDAAARATAHSPGPGAAC